MADSQSPSPTDTDVATGGPPKAPRWVKLGAIAAIIVVLLVVLVLKMSGGQHGPGRHTPPAQHSP